MFKVLVKYFGLFVQNCQNSSKNWWLGFETGETVLVTEPCSCPVVVDALGFCFEDADKPCPSDTHFNQSSKQQYPK